MNKSKDQKLLFITAVLPYSIDDPFYSLAKKMASSGWESDVYSVLEPATDDYEGLSFFKTRTVNLDQSIISEDYDTVIFYRSDSIPYTYQRIQSSNSVRTVLFDKDNDSIDNKFNIVTSDQKAVLDFLGESKTQEEKLTSIIMLTFNQIELTKKTLESLENNTKFPYELIIVDNGSDDGTIEFLKALSKDSDNIRCIFNESNLGFAKANNQGVRIAGGEYILLLNNDVILTEGWLGKLVKCAESIKSAGVVGPCTNMASGPQKTKKGYKNLEELPRFSSVFSVKNSGRWLSCHRLNAFCFLIKKQVIKEIGMLDENFGPGGFEDYDYCLRVRQAGYKVMLAGDTYVHHIGGQGYEPNKLDYDELRVVNKEIFINKWCRKALEIMEIIPDG